MNKERSERGLVAAGVPVCDTAGSAVAGLPVSMPSVWHDSRRSPARAGTLSSAAREIEDELAHALTGA